MITIAIDKNAVRRWKPYPQMRPGKAVWLRSLPAHWDNKRLKFLGRFAGGGTPAKDNLDYWNGAIPWVSPKDMKTLRISDSEDHITPIGLQSSSSRMIPVNSVLIVARSGILKHSIPVAINVRPVALNQDLKAVLLGPRCALHPEYLAYLIQGHQPELLMQWKKEGATVESLELELIADTQIPLPPPTEQCAIVAFLDHETSRLNALIAHKERLIALLEEKRQAVISHAVTRGLDPAAPMKDSGIEWLGMVLKHWDVLPLKRRWSVIDCKHRTVTFINDGFPVASIGEVQNLNIDLSNAKKASEADYLDLIDGGRRPQVGDIIYSRNATVGEAAFVNTNEPFCMGQDVCLITSKSQNQRFLLHQLRSVSVLQQLDSLLVGSTFNRINVGNIRSFFVCCPPIDEQTAIAKYCDDIIGRCDGAVARIRDGIARVQEYRTALISAAVTGQIDVRGEV